MNEAEITQYLSDTFDDLQMQVVDGNTFYFYGTERNFPFATLVTSDDGYDNFSNLNRPSVFRLNMGVSKDTFLALFGTKMSRNEGDGEPPYDFTAFDQLFPHPVYGRMYWVSIVNPSITTFDTVVKPLLKEAYNIFVSKSPSRAEKESSN
jgi:hypothetical protein